MWLPDEVKSRKPALGSLQKDFMVSKPSKLTGYGYQIEIFHVPTQPTSTITHRNVISRAIAILISPYRTARSANELQVIMPALTNQPSASIS